jgi:hypothetical protein
MNKRKTALTAAFLLVSIAVLGLVAVVYAKYISSITNTGTATVAKWSFTTDNTSGDITCEPDETYDADTLVSGRIAPGTSGKCPIEISNENTEVGVHYEIVPSTDENQPTNLKFYTDGAHQNEITGSVKLEGNLAPQAAARIVYVYWNWPYEDGTTAYDTADTADGANGSTMTMTFNVTGTQIQPSVTP